MPKTAPQPKSERSKFVSLSGTSEFLIGALAEDIDLARQCLTDLDPESYTAWKINYLITRLETTKRIFTDSYKENEPTLGKWD